jgi:hypothetical protein
MIPSINEILEQDPSSIINWLEKLLEEDLPTEFTLLGLANIAAFKAYDSPNTENNSIKWAKVAILIYDKLALNESKLSINNSFITSSMMLRVGMINKFGSINNHSILDIDIVLQWFKENLKLSYAEVKEKITNWNLFPIDEIRELRQLKNYLQVISFLNKSYLDSELRTWIALRNLLP